MMEKNKIKICSDPYQKYIEYFWYNGEMKEWENMAEMDDSPLNTDDFISATLSHKIFDIFSEIVTKLYNPQIGIEVIFEGTEDDFTDALSVKNMYFSGYDIELKFGKRRMRTAKGVMPQIEKSYDNLSEFFKEYPDEETEAIINRYHDAVKPEIAVCVMGLYSSGKSAFINSLIGREILPSASDPATAKIYKIRAAEECAISFRYHNENYRIEFQNEKWKVNKNPNSEIMKRIKECLEKQSSETEEQYMYWTLYALNDFAKYEGEVRHAELVKCADKKLSAGEIENAGAEEKIGKLLEKYRIQELVQEGEIKKNLLDDVIEINVKFVHSYLPLERFGFIIYDTPGTNSMMFQEHADILRESLRQQTDGLPIFVTTPDSMDGKDNQAIINSINELGDALDKSNMLIVINKSDEKSYETLQEKSSHQDKLFVTKWKSNRAYFVSSLIGLGGKKEDALNKTMWNDKDYYRIFYRNKDQFEDPKDPFYMRLFECNMLPQDEKQQLEEHIKTIGQEKLLLWNSGIPCVEEAIGQFAEKYALYNKCSQAIGYLTEAALSVEDAVQQAKDKAEKLSLQIEKDLDEKKKDLLQVLQQENDKKKREFIDDFIDNKIKQYSEKYLSKTRIKGIVEKAYKESKGKNDKDKLAPFNEKIESALQKDIREYAEETSKKVENYWSLCANQLRNSLMSIVVGSDALTEQQKEILKEVMLKVALVPNKHKILNISSTDAIRNKNKKFLWFWDLTRIDQEKVLEKYNNSIRNDINNNNQKMTTQNSQLFNQWTSQLMNRLKETISSFNPVLQILTSDLEKQNNIVNRKLEQERMIQCEIKKIKKLLEFQEVL